MVRTVAFVLCLAAGMLAASPPQQKIFPFPYRQEDLPNGLRLITIPTDYPNIVALYIVVSTGSRNEVEPGKTGFAHLFEHMMFRGTEKFPPDKYESVLKAAGAASNAYTSDDLTAYHTTFSKDDLETILMVEADRFQHLKYSEAAFRTESGAVLGEYNKNSASPASKLFETLRSTAFDRHTYKHTTMGFLKDIEDMPNQYEYSLQFFDRYYRPEYTTIVVCGDVNPAGVRTLVDKYWGGWKPGTYRPKVPADLPQQAPRVAHVDWTTPTLPWVVVAFRTPAYTDSDIDTAALDLIAALGFSENSELYQKLVIERHTVDTLEADNAYRMDPYLFEIDARVKQLSEIDAVQGEIVAAVERFQSTLVPAGRLDAVKRNLRYSFALRLDNSETIAGIAARAVALRRTPETLNRLFEAYARVTPQDIQRVARKYLVEKNRTIVTLTGATRKGGDAQ